MRRILSWFERHVVFVISHWVYLVLAALTGLAFAGSLVLLVYCVFPPGKGVPPNPPAAPPSLSVNTQEIKIKAEKIVAEEKAKEEAEAKAKAEAEARTKAEAEAKGKTGAESTSPVQLAAEPEAQAAPAPETPPTVPPPPTSAELLEQKIEEIHQLFPPKGHPWDSKLIRNCEQHNYWNNKCERWNVQIIKKGAKYIVTELGKIQGGDQAGIAFLDGVMTFLKGVDPAAVFKSLELYYEDYLSRIKQREDFIKAENDRFNAETAAQELEYNLAREKKAAYSKIALTGLAGTLGGFAVLAIFMAVLSVERNTRALEELIAKLSQKKPGDVSQV